METLSDYVLETIRDGTEFTLYRGRRRDSSTAVLVVAPASERPLPQILRRLEHEFSLAAELESPWAATPLALTRNEGRTILVIADPGGEPLDRILDQDWESPLDVVRFLHVAIGLATSLGHVHRRGLIHKNVNPENVFVDNAGQVRLTGFGAASRLLRERQTPVPPEIIAGTLAYMSPEQTGRMNRSIDTRSDLYSLGVTFYEMLTGMLPFAAADPLEWIHCHIARQPVPPADRRAVPAALSAITMRLLAKNAEERYQTAAGLEADLQRCLAEWQSQGRIDLFPLGTDDSSDRLLIPEKLYGREHEVDALLAAFERVVTQGCVELVLVSGYSGVGKSSVVNELHKVLVPPRGLFAAGKFDQYQRDVPYATLAQAFQTLVRQILVKGEADVDNWRSDLLDALGPDGQLMVNLIPEIEFLIGRQQPVTELPPQEARNRFQSVFRRFLGVFATAEHPLALFLDDLQWVDTATLELLERLTTDSDVRHVLLIGAYRDNEVDADHPLMLRLQMLRNKQARVHELTLGPLAHEHMEHLIADALCCEPERAAPLAALVHEKTAGNPFFVIQFLHSLFEENLVRFDHALASWSWDLDRIHDQGHTDNVVELMIGKLNRLPAETQRALQQLACLGNVAGTTTLSTVLEIPEQRVDAALWEAIRQELVERGEGSYRFGHDRIHEAAYSLVPQASRADAHLRIGRLLAAETPPEKREEAIFEIVGQLNRGAALITSRDEREQLAWFNLLAGERARASSAYASALTYLVTGAELLNDDCWERRHELIFGLELNRAACEFLTGQSLVADERLASLSKRATTAGEKASVACLHVDVCTTLDQSPRAVTVCLDYLRQVGIEWSPHPDDGDVRREYERVRARLADRTIEELIDLPLMVDAAPLATAEVLSKLFAPAMRTDQNLVSLTGCQAVSWSLEHGNCDASCFAYVMISRVAGPRFGDYLFGLRFGQLGHDLLERRGLNRFAAKTYLCFSLFVVRWMKPVRACRDLLRRAFAAANAIGDIPYGAYACSSLVSDLLFSGEPLPEVQVEAERGLAWVEKVGFGLVIIFITTQLALIRMLRGLTPTFGCFDDGQFNELSFERRLSSNPALAFPVCWYCIRKLQARYLAGDYAAALDAAATAQPVLWTLSPLYEESEYHFYRALALAAWSDSAPAGERQQLDEMTGHRRHLQAWAENCSENFADRAALVGAEIARIEGRVIDAEELYEQAIRSARKSGFVHNEAIACEVAARFYAARSLDTIADAYLRNARACYLRWGADGKVHQLDRLYSHLATPEVPRSVSLHATIDTPVGQLDAENVARASQALSSEIVLPRLIERLMRIAVEHAGAERGLLILLRGSEPLIEAEANSGHGTVDVHVRQTEITSSDLPRSTLQYVIRTRERVVLDDASVKNLYSDDEYLERRKAKSVLCLPIVKQMQLIGVLYLENNLTPHVFTADRIAVLDMLASQAAISLENARLYTDLQRSEAFLSTAQHLSQSGSFSWCIDTNEVTFSAEALRIFGFASDSPVTLQQIDNRIHPEDRHILPEKRNEARTAGEGQDYQIRLLMADGSVKYLHTTSSEIRDASGRRLYIGALQDVTQRRIAREALDKAQSELAHVSRITALNALTASIAHEINQPLAGIITNASTGLRMLQADPPNVDGARETVRRTIRDGNRATDVISRLRTLFSKREFTLERMDLNQAAREIIALTSNDLQRNGVTVQSEFAQDLPPVNGDRVQLQQVILNLIRNASEAMNNVHDRPRLLLIRTVREGDGYVRLSVRDAGIGFEGQNVDNIFDAFYTTKSGGMGIGLAVSRSIIERHQGRLWAEPNDGPGATFAFTIPSGPKGVSETAPGAAPA